MRCCSSVFVKGLREEAWKFLSRGSRSMDGGLNSSVSEYRTGVLTTPTLRWVGTVKNNRWEASFILRSPLFQRNNRWLPLVRMLGRPQRRYRYCREESVLHLLGIELRLAGRLVVMWLCSHRIWCGWSWSNWMCGFVLIPWVQTTYHGYLSVILNLRCV
jgi:hypothetical protein